MGGMLKKRGREDEGLADSAEPDSKISYRRTENLFHLLEEMECVDKIEDDECYASEEMISRLMRNLEEEIAIASCSLFPEGSTDSVACDVTSRSGCEEGGFVDLCHLLRASDDELGIPPSSLLYLDEQADFSLAFDDSGENQEINGFNGDWYFENNCVDCFQNLDVALELRDFAIGEQDCLEIVHGVY